MVIFEVSPLARFTVTCCVAADGSVTAKVVDCAGAMVTFAGSRIAFPDCTVTAAVALGVFGAVAVAVMVVPPTLTPVIGSGAVVAFLAIVTDAGTLTTPVGLALRLTVRAAGAGADRVSVAFWVVVPVIEIGVGVIVMLAPTCTVWLPVRYVLAAARMDAEPKFTPVTCGCVAGCVCPVAMVTLAGETVTFARALLDSATVIGCGAGDGRVTAKGTDCPGITLTPDGRPMVPGL